MLLTQFGSKAYFLDDCQGVSLSGVSFSFLGGFVPGAA